VLAPGFDTGTADLAAHLTRIVVVAAVFVTSIRHDDMTSFIFDSFDSFTKPPRGKGEHRSRAIPAG